MWTKGEPPKGPCAGDYTEYLCIDQYGAYRIGYWIGAKGDVLHDGKGAFTAQCWMNLPEMPDDIGPL